MHGTRFWRKGPLRKWQYFCVWQTKRCQITLALPGTQPAPRSGILRLRVRAEQPVNWQCRHGVPKK